jgi:DNA recombination protein RmuC
MEPGSVAILVIAVVAIALAAVSLIALFASRRRRSTDTIGPVLEATGRLEDQLRSISQLFLVPRTRGAVGETILAELLASWLPRRSFELQHGFRNGNRVDAVVKLGRKLVPVDSKFPVEAAARFFESNPSPETPLPGEVRRTFLKHITDIADRYIVPDEGTMAFALMYIPAERVYYSIFVERPDELLSEALRRNVVPVSPATLFVYLQTVAYGLRGLALPENVQSLIGELSRLRTDLTAFRKTFDTAGTHLRNLSRTFDDAGGRLARVELLADRLSGHEGE